MAIENLVFPFHKNTALNIWRRALVKEGLDDKCPNTGTVKLRPHTLRKYFRTYHGASVEVKEMLMGHRGYLTDQYVRYTVDDLRKAYKLGVSGVEIYGDSKQKELVKADLEAACARQRVAKCWEKWL
jgi:integrase